MQNMREVLRRNRMKYHLLYSEMERFHDAAQKAGKGNKGHGWEHDLSVSQYGVLIANLPEIGELCWIAGLIHSTDRFYPKGTPDELIRDRLGDLLDLVELEPAERSMILEAVLEHSKKNSDKDSELTQTLKDADRLTSLNALILIRGAQFFPTIPACSLGFIDRLHPDSKFGQPISCLDNLRYVMEWETWLRLPKAIEIGKPFFDYLRGFFALVQEQLGQIGLDPWPIPE